MICSFASALINYQLSCDVLRKRLVELELPVTSDSLYSEIQKDLVRPVFIARQMAHNTLLRDWTLSGEQDVASITRYLSEIKEKENAHTSFFVSEKTNRYYYSNGILKEISSSDIADRWYFRIRDASEPYEINVDLDATNKNTHTVFVNYQTRDYQNNLLGITGIGLSLENVNDRVKAYEDRYKRRIFFVDGDGYPTLNQRSEESQTSIRKQPGIQTVANKILTQSTIPVKSTYQLNEANVQVHSRYIKELQAYLLVEQNERVALAPLQRILVINLGVTLLATFLVGGLIWLIVNQNQKQLKKIASTDVLTGLENRLSITPTFDRLIESYEKNQVPFVTILLDIDHFKKVNDEHGHPVGDKVISFVTRLAKQHVRASDYMFRWGGEEFLIALNDCDLENGKKTAEKIRDAIQENTLQVSEQLGISVTASLGVAQIQDSEDFDSLIARADKALYAAKGNGRNRTELAHH